MQQTQWADPHRAAFPSRFDLLLRGGTVIDGTGAAPVVADVGIVGERIAAIGHLAGEYAAQTVQCQNRYVCPGFIDIHTHSDLSILYTPGMDSSLLQGVTCEVAGNCGFSLGLSTNDELFAYERRGLSKRGVALNWGDMAGYLRRVEEEGTAIHFATLAGHGSLRKRVMGLAERTPTDDELTEMQDALQTALDEGAIGLSSGLEYVPGMYAGVREMTALATVAAQAGTFYATHLRDEGDAVVEAVAEAIAVAEGAGISLQLSHHKAEKPRNWGKVTKTLALVDAAQARGVDILLDQYPYTAFQTSLGTIALPPSVVAGTGTPQELATKLQDDAARAMARGEMVGLGLDWSAIQIASCSAHRDYQGKTIAALSAQAGDDPRDFVLNLLAEGEMVSAAYFALSEDDVIQVLRDSRVMIGSDSVATRPVGLSRKEHPHPRTYGTFARVLARYVRDKEILTWPEAIRRMTSLPAQRLRFSERGRIAPGMYADVVVLDPRTVGDAATFAAPHAFATGIETVLVNGTLAVEDGQPTGARAGKVLRRAG